MIQRRSIWFNGIRYRTFPPKAYLFGSDSNRWKAPVWYQTSIQYRTGAHTFSRVPTSKENWLSIETTEGLKKRALRFHELECPGHQRKPPRQAVNSSSAVGPTARVNVQFSRSLALRPGLKSNSALFVSILLEVQGKCIQPRILRALKKIHRHTTEEFRAGPAREGLSLTP